MAKNQTVRLSPPKLQADVDSLSALQGIPAYAPNNPLYITPALQSKMEMMRNFQQAEAQALAALNTARDAAAAAEWGFHNAMLAAKDQVIAQFGDDSNEVQALGLKKKSEYKTPVRKAKTA
jgi:hypothetical protein